MIAAPDTVHAGHPFDAVVTTLAPRSCWRSAGAAVEPHPALAVVTPYDFTPETGEAVCGDVVRVLGRRVEGWNLRETRRVVVRP